MPDQFSAASDHDRALSIKGDECCFALSISGLKAL
jgi:hypothetical protein